MSIYHLPILFFIYGKFLHRLQFNFRWTITFKFQSTKAKNYILNESNLTTFEIKFFLLTIFMIIRNAIQSMIVRLLLWCIRDYSWFVWVLYSFKIFPNQNKPSSRLYRHIKDNVLSMFDKYFMWLICSYHCNINQLMCSHSLVLWMTRNYSKT